MIRLLRKLFCKHSFGQTMTLKSKRFGNDNHVLEVSTLICMKCGKRHVNEVINRIEENWYIESKEE